MTDLPRRHKTAPLTYEQQAAARGYQRVAGLDEAGRGPWAGPLLAAAVILPAAPDLLTVLKGARDSKQMTHRQRAHAAEVIGRVAVCYGIGIATVEEIEQLGLEAALRAAYQRALNACDPSPDFVLIDHTQWPQQPLPHLSITRGDQLSLSVACASILAKTWRDQFMLELHARFPAYGFDRHKGYGTPQHQAALRQHGPLPGVHRRVRPIVQARLL